MTTWDKGIKPKKFPKMDGDETADVAIIGGGITGILNAYFLSKTGRSVVLLEKNQLLSNATPLTTAIITRIIDSEFREIESMFDRKTSRIVSESGQEAIETLEKIIKEEKISCEFVRCSNYYFGSTPAQFKKLKEEFKNYKNIGIDAELHESGADLHFNNFGYLEIKDQAKFHVGKSCHALAEKCLENGVKVFENTEALEIRGDDPVMVQTKSGAVIAKKVIIATYQPLTNEKTHLKKGMYTSYMFEVDFPGDFLREGVYEDNSNPYYYFRVDKGMGTTKYKDRMLIGGEDHREILNSKRLEKESYKSLNKFLDKILPSVKYKITDKWTGPILEPSDGLPLIGKIKDNYFVATAFSGNGMTYSVISAILIKDLITGKSNQWEKVYDPKRSLGIKSIILKGIDYTEELFNGALRNLLND